MTTIAPESPEFLRPSRERTTESRVVAHMTIAEYAAFSREAEEKHELVDGEVVSMSRASIEHNRINANLLRLLGDALDTSSIEGEVIASDQGVAVDNGTVLLPDTVIIRGEAQIDNQDNLHNPFAIFEILSSSTAAFDQGAKFAACQTIDSLEHYVLINQYEVSVTHFAKSAGNRWTVVGRHSDLDDTLALTIGDDEISIRLSAIYRRVMGCKGMTR